MSDDPRSTVLDLTTTLAPAEVFAVDSTEYEILGLDHLSANEEAEVMGSFAKFRSLSEKYEAEGDEKKAEQIAAVMIAQRIKILCRLTTMPIEVARKLPVSGQAKLMKYLESTINVGEEE